MPKRNRGELEDKSSVENVQYFFVDYESYESSDDAEDSISDVDTWWQSAEFKPLHPAVCLIVEPDEKLIWRSINSNKSVLVSGKAGSGKSNLLNRFRIHCPPSGHGFNYRICGSTGISANNISGTTLHKCLNLGLAKQSARDLYDLIQRHPRKYKSTLKFLNDVSVLIIDEISMIDPTFFSKLDKLFRLVRNVDSPFGGVILVMMGDFTQLGPVITKGGSGNGVFIKYVFQTDTWKSMKISRIILERSFRQKDDDQFLTLLNEVRIGYLSKESKEVLKGRIIHNKKDKIYNGLYPIDVFPFRYQVKQRNKKQLLYLGKDIVTFTPFIYIDTHENWSGPISKNDLKKAEYLQHNVSNLEKCFNIGTLEICVGSQVMMKSNHLINFNIFNGTLGLVTSVDNDHIGVRFMIGGKLEVYSRPIERRKFTHRVGNTVDIVMNQFPIVLGWASTIHKVQGLTLNTVCVDVRNCFEAGQFYVAISRVKHLKDLFLLGFNEKGLIVDEDALAFEIDF